MVIGLGIVVALATAYPRGDGLARSLSSQPASELSVAYLEASLRAQPSSPEYMNLLATQYVKLGRWQQAIQVADRLEQLAKDGKAREQALLIKVAATEQMTYEVSPDDPRRAERVARFTQVLEETSQYTWNVSAMKSFAEMARQIGAKEVMTDYYRKLAATDAGNSAPWLEKIGEVALAHQAYDDAALAYFSAYDASHTLDARRHYFIEALKALESGNLVDRACSEGAKRIDADLARDPQTLRYLLDLARQANRTDLVSRYARALIQVLPLSMATVHRASLMAAGPRASAVPIPLYQDALPRTRYLAQMVATQEKSPTAVKPTVEAHGVRTDTHAEYELVFTAFVESGQLDDAEQVARKALAAHMDPPVWTRRLAEVAQWNNHPDEALKYWQLYAQSSGSGQAWSNVLTLAPQLDDDQAYLVAWKHTEADSERNATDSEAGLNSLLGRYMQLGHWESAQRVVDGLKGKGTAKTQQKVLWLDTVVAEQLAYRFPPDNPGRGQGMTHYVDVLKQTTEYKWDIPAMTQLAKMAGQAGAESVKEHYYQALASTDVSNASKWQEQLGEAALGRQAYDEAAKAYFAAQDTASTLVDKRRNFIAGLKALVSGDQVGRASSEGEKRAGDLAKDPETLRYLINVARQASNRELMGLYARNLIKYADQSRHDINQYSGYADYAAYAAANHVALAKLDRLQLYKKLVRDNALLKATDQTGMRLVAQTEVKEGATDTATKSSDYDLAFQAFVESNQLNEAEKLARSALEHHLDPLIWTRRLAQIAQWNKHPDVALKYWLQFAKESGSDEAWENVLKLAPQLDNDQAYLAALIHAADRSPGNLPLQDKVVAAYERLGQPEAGMAYLNSRAKGAVRRPLLERYAALADRSGDDKIALQAYRKLLVAYPASSVYATHVASLEYQQGNMAEALAVLRDVRSKVGDDAEAAPYWRLYAELARQTQNDKDAEFAYKHLLATGQSDAPDLTAMTYFYQAHPIDAGRVAEMQFRKDSSSAALAFAMQYYTAADAWPRIHTLLASLTPEQQAQFHNSAALLAARAEYYLHTQRWDAALIDLRRAVLLPDADDETRITYLWALVDFGTDEELNKAVTKWRSIAKINSGYWGAFAAAELRIGHPARALVYLRQQRVQSGDDPLWLMSLADAEEASGNTSQAWDLRRKSWSILQHKATTGQLGDVSGLGVKLKKGDKGQRLNSADSLDLIAARVTLSQTFANGTYSRALLVDMLKQEGSKPGAAAVANSILADNPGLPTLNEVFATPSTKPVVGSIASKHLERERYINAVAKSTVMAWAVSGEYNDLGRAWLAREYANRLLRPADAEIALALASNDKETLARVLDSQQGRVSTTNRIAALVQTGRTSEGETVAFHAAQGAPDNDDLHATMVETLMRDRPYVGADVMGSWSTPLRYVQSSVAGGLKLTSRIGLNFEAVQRNQQTTDTDQLAWVPAHDREFNLTLSDKTIDRAMSLTVGNRNAVKSFYTGLLQGEFDRRGPLTTSFAVGINQFTDLTPQMQVGATKDLARVGMDWNPESRWFVQSAFEVNRYHAQDRAYMGRGYDLSGAIGYRVRSEFPDWNIRVVGSRGIYGVSNNVISSLGSLLPPGEIPSATEFMPQNYTQYGLMVGLGTDDRNTYSRPWRPFVDVGYVHDSNQGWGPQVNLGLSGPVLGNDHLRIFYVHESAARGSGQRVSQIGLSYRLFY
ncbi:Tetratricopeptide repeat protein OS=Eoetvoesiella caeni OX=645616 GN=DFR37_11648 PE=4 SV=1 [Eoetvoesiella caeni]|uniref:Tetratricopeptide repeat protein n=1 Tax=Eoetvoesiella caeni TaxID=645616 RepID=A0A366H241_9BURK|nr:tetratricopeptide repeat protein [Eoetvoesiella caeni]